MMLPSAVPMLLRFQRAALGRGAGAAGWATAWVARGYFAVWLAVGALAYVIGVGWALATMRSAALSRAVPALTGVTLVLAGAFQFSRWKPACLDRWRHPLACGAAANATARRAAWSHGLHQGAACALCCSDPMLVMLALGAMNPVVMLTVALLIAFEKLLARPRVAVRLAGTLALAVGTVIVTRALLHG